MAENTFRVDITKQFEVDKLDGEELHTFLSHSWLRNVRYELGSSKFSSKKTTYSYNNEFYITFRREKVIKIEKGLNLDITRCEEICKSINDILIKKKGKQVIKTEILFSENPFVSFYIYKNLFGIGEMPKTLPQPDQLAAPHPLILQYKYTATEMPTLNLLREAKKIEEIIYLMSVFSDHSLHTFTVGDSAAVWVLKKGKHISELRQAGYYCDYRKLNNIFKEKRVEVFPYAHHIDKYFDLNSALKEQFITACYWYYKANTSSCVNDRYLYYITTIETLINRNEENNKENNPKELHEKILEEYREKRALPDTNYRELFDDFFTKYEKAVNTINTKGSTYQFKKFLEEYAGIKDKSLVSHIYSLRSNMSHTGETICREENVSSFSEAGYITGILQQICKISLLNWLNQQSGVKADRNITLSGEELEKQYINGVMARSRQIDEIIFSEKHQFPWKTNAN